MALDTEAVLRQIDSVLARCGASADQPAVPRAAGTVNVPDVPNVAMLSTACLTVIDRLALNTTYSRTAREIVDGGNLGSGMTLNGLIGVLVTLRDDVEAGYTESFTELVHADVFSDFLDMADELQRNGYKDAAAVIAGSTLEEHLRKLAQRAGLPIENAGGEPLRGGRLNDDLKAAGVYNALEQKCVVAWLDLRNNAAHARYDEYDIAQVATLIGEVRNFMLRHPA